jgi:CRP-like cAMP-binding protein
MGQGASVPTTNPLIRKLSHLIILSDVEKNVLTSACSQIKQLGADEDVVRDRDEPSDCNLLLEGMVFRYKILEDGKRQIMAFHTPGDIFDAQSFILERMDHSIGTLVPCKVAVIPHRTMLEITESYPRIARAIWKDTLVDAAIFREWMTSIGRRTSGARIAHLMCEMFVKLQIVGMAEGNQISWPITQEEIGDSLGLSSVHVNRTLQDLRAASLVTLDRRTLTIHDWEGLKAAGQFDQNYLHLKPGRVISTPSKDSSRQPSA